LYGGIEINYNPLSFLGDFYSFEKLRFDLSGGDDCYRNPSSEIQVQTIHIKTRDKVNLQDLVEEESLVAALKNDTWVKNLMGINNIDQLDAKNSFEEILDLINRGIGNTFHSDSFALYSYNEKTNLLAVRLIGIEYIGYNHSRKLQLGLLLKPRDEIRKQLEKKEGFYMGKF